MPDDARPHRFVTADAPRFAHTAEEIAAALAEVGRGASYREAARRTRADGNTVAGWVELLAPALYAEHASARWPENVVLDSIGFSARDGALCVLAALEPLSRRKSRLVALEAFTNVRDEELQALWGRFLRARDGTPTRAVCAPDADLLTAVNAAWPQTAVVISPRHLAGQLLALLHDEGVAAEETFHDAAAHALDGPDEWAAFLSVPAPRRLRLLEDWLRENADRIAGQLEHADAAAAGASLLAKKLERLRAQLEPRRANLRNRERTNCLLMLAHLELDGRSDETAYARAIERALGERARREAHPPPAAAGR